MKKFQFFPLMILSSVALAETATVVDATPVISGTETVTSQSENTVVLPQLSLEAQQARAAEFAKTAEAMIQQQEEMRIAAQKLAEAESRVKQEVGNHLLLLTSASAKAYLDNNFAPLWQDKIAEKIFLKEYAVFVASGVSTKSAQALQQILNSNDGFARDILLTDAFLDYLYYNKNVGKNANQWLYNLGSYSPKSPEESLINMWVSAVKNGSVDQFISNLVPRNHIYQETVQRLFDMSSASATTSGKKGVKGKKVSANATSTNSTTFAKLALNAQRLRLIPSFNNGIFVNIPSYQLYYFRDGSLALQSRVIVGRTDRRTPVMYSKLSNVVVNPPWNVPVSIKNKDLVPKLRRDPGLADRLNYEIIDGNGNKINPRSINWAAYEGKNNFPYHIRQKAGDNSALGRYKFNMPSSDAIYLHDTPNHALFGKNDRALSSGCVRVDKSDELASLLLKSAGWSEQKRQGVLASQKTTSAPIYADTPVYLYYVTSWVEGGKVYNLPDIYGYDANLPKTSLDWARIKSML